MTFNAEYAAVKHGINIIGPGFKRTGIEAAGFERRKQRNGDGRFAAAGVLRGDEHLQHVIPSQSKKRDYSPSSGANYRLNCCGLWQFV